MEIHLPHPIRNVTDFLVHLALIILGILIALGLEQLVEHHHRAQVAAQAVAGFRRELRDNRDAVEKEIKSLKAVREQIKELTAALSQLPAADKARHFIQYPDVRFEQISTASWDTAIATQVLNDIAPEEARRYSAAYGVFRIFMEEERTGLGLWQQLFKFGLDGAALTPEQRLRLIEALNGYNGFTYIVELLGQETVATCDAALR